MRESDNSSWNPSDNLSKVIRSNSNGRFTIAARAFESERSPLGEENTHDLQRPRLLNQRENDIPSPGGSPKIILQLDLDQVTPLEEPGVENEEVFDNCLSRPIYETTENLLDISARKCGFS